MLARGGSVLAMVASYDSRPTNLVQEASMRRMADRMDTLLRASGGREGIRYGINSKGLPSMGALFQWY